MVSVTLMLRVTQIPAKVHVKVQMTHGTVVVLQMLCAGIKTVRRSAAKIPFVKAEHAKLPVLTKMRKKPAAVLNPNLTASRVLVQTSARKILNVKQMIVKLHV
jgi:hypothetical protein